MLRKNLSPATLLVLSPALALTEALTWAFCARRGPAYLRAKWRSYRRLWAACRLAGRSTVANRYPDRALLGALSARLMAEQLDASKAATLANGVLTAFYALWRSVALAIVHW
jgi:hypothetical protein